MLHPAGAETESGVEDQAVNVGWDVTTALRTLGIPPAGWESYATHANRAPAGPTSAWEAWGHGRRVVAGHPLGVARYHRSLDRVRE